MDTTQSLTESKYRRLRGFVRHVLPVLRGHEGGHWAGRGRALIQWNSRHNRETRLKGVCSWCGLPVEEEGRTYWHKLCELQMRTTLGSAAGPQLGNRDVCAICGFDNRTDSDTAFGAIKSMGLRPGPAQAVEWWKPPYQQFHQHEREMEIEHQYPIHKGRRDGLKGLVRAFLLENLRWVCVPCHRAKTRAERQGKTAANQTDLRQLKLQMDQAGPQLERCSMKTRQQVALDLIDDNPWQPRQAMDPGALQDLADDIHELGLLQVPLARPALDGRFQLAFGHRRVGGCRLLRQQEKWGDSVDLDVEDLTDEQMALIALSENVQRKQLTQIEVVRAHKRAIDDTDLTIQALADKIGLDRATLANNLRVLDLPAVVLKHVESGDLSMGSAREFLVLQHTGHTHLEDVQSIVRNISSFYGRRGIPDWTRRHVREQIYLRVAYNEQDWRPLGPKPARTGGGANKQATFDIDAFRAEYPDSIHTIPAVSKADVVNFEEQITCDGSRVWTCEVKEWSRRQSRVTREANQATETAGTSPSAKKKNDKDSQLGELLAKDPVWKKIAAAREKKGPHRPVTDEERKQLGTRAELKDLNPYARNGFWKLLQMASKGDSPNRWMDQDGGLLPPFFADLDGCGSCTAGAAYVTPNSFHSRNGKPQLACFNKRCYTQKVDAGAAEYRGKLEAHKKGLFREDREAAQRLMRGMGGVDGEALRALATTLVAQTDRLELQHPFGEFVAEWSYESGATSRAREILGLDLRTGMRGVHYLGDDGLNALDQVDQGDLRELVANLMTHHLRVAGRIDTVSRETPEPVPAATA